MPVTIFRIPAMSRRLTFDPMADFSWIIHLTGHVFGVVVRSDSRYRSWEEFLDYAKANPGRVSYGSPGVGTSLHITMERIAAERGIEFLHVPFRGGADTTQALLNGSVECAANSTGWAPMVQEGCFRLLVVWSAERAKRFPKVRTLPEVGGIGGLFAVNAAGNVALPFGTEGMYRGLWRAGAAPEAAIHAD